MDRRGWLVDGVLAVAAFALSAAIANSPPPTAADVREPDVVAYVILAVYSGALVLRNGRPRAAVWIGLAAGFAYSAANYPPALTPVLLPAYYTAGARLETTSARRLLALSVVVVAVGATLGPGPVSTSPPLLVAGAWLVGRYVRSNRLATEELAAKNRELERAQQDLARQAVTEERLRIARELHDVVAHSMSVVAVHAGSGRMVAEEDPAAAGRALATIETTTRSALAEMRRLLEVLRSDADANAAPALAPAPGLADLDTLVAEVSRSGVPVELRVSGPRAGVPPGVDLSAYRIVQEALTNVLKHAGPARAVVSVRYGGGELAITVDDDGAGASSAGTAGGGLGLPGMRERATAHGGSLDAGPGPEGGFHVVARFPLGND